MTTDAADTIDLSDVTRLDVNTLTLGEMAEAEWQSGKPIADLVRSPTSVLILALFVHELRTSAQPRSWRELASLPLSALRS